MLLINVGKSSVLSVDDNEHVVEGFFSHEWLQVHFVAVNASISTA